MPANKPEYQREYMRKYRKAHKSRIERLMIRAIELKIAFDLSTEECVKRAFEEVKTK